MLTIYNIGRLVTMEPGPDREGALGVIPRGALRIDGETIAWVGPEVALPPDAITATSIDAENGVVMPGLIDSHTHVVYAGSRAMDFVRRARGETYQAIAAAGGGILSTVRATREASEETLLTAARERAWQALRLGTTTIEIKSGYGLDTATECKILRVAKQIAAEAPVTCFTTLLGAHVVPEEYADDRSRYVTMIVDEMLPAVTRESLADACDVFVDALAFSPDEARAICAAARGHGLAIRLHIDQFRDEQGGLLAAEVGAASADHCDYLNDAGIAAMRERGVVAGLLPGASFFVPPGRRPPVEGLVRAGVPIAIATDHNPGTSPTLDLFLCGTIAVTQWGLDPDLALLGLTRNAAKALGRESTMGSLAPDKQADCLVLGCENEYVPLYRFGTSVVQTVICKGAIAWGSLS